MRTTKIVSLISLLGVLLLAPVAATYAAPETGLYLGGSWGAYKVDEGDLDDNDDMLKGFVGWQFVPWFGIEGQWTDFNRLDQGSDRFEADGRGLSAVFTFPLSNTSSLFAKAGNFWWESNSSFASGARDDDGSDPFFGAGFQLGFNRHVALRLEWERFDIADVDVDAFTAGIQFTF